MNISFREIYLSCPSSNILKTRKLSVFPDIRMGKVLSFLSSLITLACLAFLIFMGTQCMIKFSEKLKGTNVGIVKASKHSYPDITICPLEDQNDNQHYNKVLKRYNLSTTDYFEDAKWKGTGNDSFCNSPSELYDEMVGGLSNYFNWIDNGQDTFDDQTNYTYMDHSDPLVYGRCIAVPSSEFQITEVRVPAISKKWSDGL